MTVAECTHSEAMYHLSKARKAMEQLTACTADWSAGVQFEIGFDALEESCREFARCRFGLACPSKIGVITPEK